MENKSTILIVDDTETNIDILLELLGDRYDIMVALDGKSALEIAQEEGVHLILLDIMMPELDGYEVCEKLKTMQNTKDIPVIFITAKTDEDSIEKAYEVGGVDYVTKPFKPRELLARVKNQLELQSLIKHLEFIGAYDQLTGIYNRRKFFELSEYKFDNGHTNLYAVMIDIDKFKLVNDTYGHPTGDRAIKLVTQTISKFLDEDWIFGRLGGEEFCIVCNVTPTENIGDRIEFMRKEIQDVKLLSDTGDTIKITVSAGYAKAQKDVTTLDELLKEADAALYEAKGSGRNRVIFRS